MKTTTTVVPVTLIQAATASRDARIRTLTQHVACWRVVVRTQVWENYGAHSWDGQGECPQYWKAKGGRDITLRAWSVEPLESEARALAAEWSGECNNYFQEEMIGWRLLAPGQLTEDESDRLAWDPILCKLKEMVDDARRVAAHEEWEREQADLLEQEAHDRGRARP